MKKIKWQCKRVSISLVDPSPTNYKIASELGLKRFVQSVSEFGRAGSRVVNLGSKGRYVLIDGNSNLDDAKRRGEKHVDISYPSRKLTDKEFVKMCKVFDAAKAGDQDMNRIAAETTDKNFFKQYGLPMPTRFIDNLGANSETRLDAKGDKAKEKKSLVLRDKWIEPPFSVLDTKQDSWQKRKQDWLDWGIVGELGREGTLVEMQTQEGKIIGRRKLTSSLPTKKYSSLTERHGEDMQRLNTSVFDPALSELMYSWFVPKGGKILDPFAGGPSRGLVAQQLGYKYTGIDLNQQQIKENIELGRKLLKSSNQPLYYHGDSNELLGKKWKDKFDFIFSCPPYFNLEVYSKDPRDLSAMTYDAFLANYRSIIRRACLLLKPNRYACFVVSPVRDKRTGEYIDLVEDTKQAFRTGSNIQFYNDAVLLNMIGSASLRADRQFEISRKLVRIHQNVLIFYKP